MEKSNKIFLLILLALALAAALYPLIAYAIANDSKRQLAEAKLEQIDTLSEATSSKSFPLGNPKGTELEPAQGSTTSLSNPSEIPNSSIASWYDYNLKDLPGYSRENATAASRDYPRGSILRVTNTKTGASVEVRVNDYGPEAWTGRHIDLSSFAFSQIASKSLGLAEVTIEKIK